MMAGSSVVRKDTAELPSNEPPEQQRQSQRAKKERACTSERLEARSERGSRTEAQISAEPVELESLFCQDEPAASVMLQQIRTLNKRMNIDHCDICGHQGLL